MARIRPGKGTNKNPKLTLVRKASTSAVERYGIGGRPKRLGGPKKPTLPKVKFLEDKD